MQIVHCPEHLGSPVPTSSRSYPSFSNALQVICKPCCRLLSWIVRQQQVSGVVTTFLPRQMQLQVPPHLHRLLVLGLFADPDLYLLRTSLPVTDCVVRSSSRSVLLKSEAPLPPPTPSALTHLKTSSCRRRCQSSILVLICRCLLRPFDRLDVAAQTQHAGPRTTYCTCWSATSHLPQHLRLEISDTVACLFAIARGVFWCTSSIKVT